MSHLFKIEQIITCGKLVLPLQTIPISKFIVSQISLDILHTSPTAAAAMETK